MFRQQHRGHRHRGQATLLALVALGVFVLGSIGLAIESSFLFLHRQMAQAAADAAAEAAVMSVFNSTNTATYSNAFGGSAFTCTTGTDTRTPCVYARYHGFGVTANETVSVDFPTSVPGVSLSADDTPAAVAVTVTRTMNTGFLRLVGANSGRVRARAVGVITDVFSPVPIVVMHPTRSGSFAINGNPTIKICGGPTKSIQVNSSSPTSITISGSANVVDLSQAGPVGFVSPTSCNGTGADFGDFGGPSTYPGNLLLGSDGDYVQPASPIEDPLGSPVVADITTPPPAALGTGLVPGQTGGCPLPTGSNCVLYYPGTYPGGISLKNDMALFTPGVYYMDGGGFEIVANGQAHMAPCGSPNPDTGCGMVIYNAPKKATDKFFIAANAGKTSGVSYTYTFYDGITCTGNCLLGADEAGPYKGVLFFGKRTPTSYAVEHELHGGGGLTLRGTLYLTNTEPIMRGNPALFQKLILQGTPGSTTRVLGMILVDALELGGNATINMTLNPNASLNIRQVALAR